MYPLVALLLKKKKKKKTTLQAKVGDHFRAGLYSSPVLLAKSKYLLLSLFN